MKAAAFTRVILGGVQADADCKRAEFSRAEGADGGGVVLEISVERKVIEPNTQSINGL